MNDERYEIKIVFGPYSFERAGTAFDAVERMVETFLPEAAVTLEELVPHDANRRVRLEELARAAVGLDRDEQLRHDPFCADSCGLPRWSAQPVKGCACGITAFMRAREALR